MRKQKGGWSGYVCPKSTVRSQTILSYTKPSSRFPPRFSTIFFVAFDLASFLIQLLGGSFMTTANRNQKLSPNEREEQRNNGRNILRFGLFLQVIRFSLFALVTVQFIIVSRHWDGCIDRRISSSMSWIRLNWAVTTSAFLILVCHHPTSLTSLTRAS
ncbi:unnamed protein product [Periconia digitata]|uniref:Uncharacterized protein n=1 Tax=Periconia digitata TaxID=1303443 RepID=A0A9W4UET2_9PLEO|nr:unnamed protein product [Periconia digitata]